MENAWILWVVIIYLLTVLTCSWLYKKLCEREGDSEEKKRIEYFYNIDKIAWIVSWIPLLNLYFIYLFSAGLWESYHEESRIRKILSQEKDGVSIKSILEKVQKDNPDDEGSKQLLDFINNKKTKKKSK